MLGAIIHTINFRLPPDQMVYSMIHAGDEWVFVSEIFMKAVESLASKFSQWVLMTEKKNLSFPANRVYNYEELVETGKGRELLESDAVHEDNVFSIFYTTGTTGRLL